MKKIIIGFVLLAAVAVASSGCGLFKKPCNCPHFEARN